LWKTARKKYLYGLEIDDLHQGLATLRHQRDEQDDAMLQREVKVQRDREELTNVAEAAHIHVREAEKRALSHGKTVGLRHKTIEVCHSTLCNNSDGLYQPASPSVHISVNTIEHNVHR